MNLVIMFNRLSSPRNIREGPVRCRLYRFLGDPTMYRHLLSPLMAFAVSNSISLFCLAIVILSFTAQYIPSLYLTNMCNTICLIFLTAFIATRALPPSPATRASDVPHIPSPSPSTRTPPSPPTTHHFPFYPDVQGASLSDCRFKHRIQP